jgi:hypothetical protein
MSHKVKYGLYDTQTDSWAGNAEGPYAYDHRWEARPAATKFNKQANAPGRFKAKALPSENTLIKGGTFEITKPPNLIEQ